MHTALPLTPEQAPSLILASGSPRRQQLVRQLGLACAVIVADIDETPLPGEHPGAMTCRLAEEKARAVAQRRQDRATPTLIIASDTTVALDDVIYGKPLDEDDARRILIDLRDRTHQVITAVSILHLPSDRQVTRVNTSLVHMRAYSDAEIEDYIATGDPYDKAGAYAIQARPFDPVQRIDGCYAGIMGLPLAELAGLLAEFGVTVPAPVAVVCAEHNPFACCAAPDQSPLTP